MFKDIKKRISFQLLIYIIVMYLIPFITTNFLSESVRDIVNSLFMVVFNLMIIIFIATYDTYKYKLNCFLWIIPGLLFLPTIYLFFGGSNVLIIYSLLYCFSYGIGMLSGWSYKTYGHQLKPGYKKKYVEEKKEQAKKKKELKQIKKEKKIK